MLGIFDPVARRVIAGLLGAILGLLGALLKLLGSILVALARFIWGILRRR